MRSIIRFLALLALVLQPGEEQVVEIEEGSEDEPGEGEEAKGDADTSGELAQDHHPGGDDPGSFAAQRCRFQDVGEGGDGVVLDEPLDPAARVATEEAAQVLVTHALEPPEAQPDAEDGEPLLLGEPVEDVQRSHRGRILASQRRGRATICGWPTHLARYWSG